MRRRELLIATSNQGKLREVRDILKDLDLRLFSLSDCAAIQPVEETGATFIENASLKATEYACQAKIMTLADDSGLEVDALNGAPGVLSARYLGEATSYPVRNQSLLAELDSHKNRAARFVCAIAIADPNGKILHFSNGVCEGRIAMASRGDGGFGYDPIFVPEGFEMTFGELSAEIKNRISHRARALAGAREFLTGLTAGSTAG